MRDVDTLLVAPWIVPVEPDRTVLEGHAVAVAAGRIVGLVPVAEADAEYRAASRHEYPGHVLIPGLVNAHTHAAMSLFRGLADDLPLMQWLEGHIWPAEGRWVDARFVREGTRLAAAEMLRGGVTCFNDMYFFPDEAGRAASDAGMRAVVGIIVVNFPTVWARDPDEYFAKGTEVHDRFRDDPLVTTAFAPHAPYTVDDHALERVRTLAEELDIPVHMHLHETADEVSRSIGQSGERPMARLARLGLLTPRLAAVHMTRLDPAEIARAAECGVHVVHCPVSNLKLASGFCPVARLTESGVEVALGSDGAASNNTLDILGEMRIAALLAKGVAETATALPAAQALRMATLNGARALGLGDRIGSLVPGKQADVVAVDLSAIESQPVHHPLSQLVYACGRHQVTDVWVAGRRVVANRGLLSLDEAAIAADARAWRARLEE